MRVTSTHIDGTERTVQTETFMCLADRVAFERHFDISSTIFNQLANLFDEETGETKPEADLSALREEWTVFFAWRALHREHGDELGEYQAFVESVVGIDVAAGEVENPTTPVPPSD